jgi:hypothetical protein
MRLRRANDGMARGVEVFGRVPVLGGVAAAHMPAGDAGSQMNPGISQRDAFFADMRFGGNVTAVDQMFAECQQILLVWAIVSRMLSTRMLAR